MLLSGKELKLRYFQGNGMCFLFTNVCLQIGKTAKLLLMILNATLGKCKPLFILVQDEEKICICWWNTPYLYC